MKILITGICGFAGSVIARGLLEHEPGLQIFGMDNLLRPGSETNVEPLRFLGIDVRIGDIRNEDDIAALPSADWVIDCAANPSVLAGVDGKTSAKELLDHNLGGTIHLLEYCRRHQAGFILLSTSRVYSIKPLAELPVKVHDDAFVPDVSAFHLSPSTLSAKGVRESFPTDPPISLYGSSKKCSELLALEYGVTFDFPVWINRCGVLAGAGQFGKADQGIFSYWIHSWASQRPLKYIGFGGKGHQVRDCLHPSDLVPILLEQMETSWPQKAPATDPAVTKRPGFQHSQIAADSSLCSLVPPVAKISVPQIINLSGGIENAMSLAQLSRWCTERLGPHPSFPLSEVSALQESRPFDIPWMVLDSGQAKEIWGWQPTTSLHTVLEEIAQHAEANPNWLDLVT